MQLYAVFFFIFMPMLCAVLFIIWPRRAPATSTELTYFRRRPGPQVTMVDKISATPDRPENFGYKMSWLAVKSTDAKAVVDSLKMKHVQPGNWKTGLLAAYGGHAFVSPSVNGWVLVVSHDIPEFGDESAPDALPKLLSELSITFGETQYFGTHRVVEYQAWARFLEGKQIRAFAYLGERGDVLIDVGEKSTGEIELGYDYFDPDSPDAKTDSYWERDDLTYPDETHVMQLSDKWSINPASIEDLALPEGLGWIGDLK